MSEMFDKINAKSDAAAASMPDLEESIAVWEREAALRKKKAQQRADMGFGLRCLVFGGVLWGLMAVTDAGLMAEALAGGLLLLLFVWFGFYAGAWWQFRFGKDGVLHGSK